VVAPTMDGVVALDLARRPTVRNCDVTEENFPTMTLRFSQLLSTAMAVALIAPVGLKFNESVTLSQPTSPVATSYYLSLGDSLAQGFQPGFNNRAETLYGYSNQVVTDLKSQRHFILENFGCGGETSGWMLTANSCAVHNRSLNSAYVQGETPMESVLRFIARHRGHIGLITLIIGINDYVTNTPLSQTVTNIEQICAELRHAVGSGVPIIGLDYDDPHLAQWLQGPSQHAAVAASVQQVEAVTDPALQSAYVPSHATFVDVAKAFQTFVPLTTTVTLAPYGTIPVAVARICVYTWACSIDNPHPTTAGYSAMALLIASAYRQITHLPTPLTRIPAIKHA